MLDLILDFLLGGRVCYGDKCACECNLLLNNIVFMAHCVCTKVVCILKVLLTIGCQINKSLKTT